jgi:hypothetical protein
MLQAARFGEQLLLLLLHRYLMSHSWIHTFMTAATVNACMIGWPGAGSERSEGPEWRCFTTPELIG